MSVPCATAESSLYQSRKQYRTRAGGLNRRSDGIHLADSVEECVEDCVNECLWAGGLRYECEPPCRHSCQTGPPPPCDSFWVDGREYCCTRNTEPCIGPVRADGGRNVSCLHPGMACCQGISYWLDSEVCINGTVERCWPRPTCPPFGCCKMDEVCTDEGCVPQNQICPRSQRRCKPHEECTHDEGCIPRDQVCGPSNRRCKEPGEVCTAQGCCDRGKATEGRTRCCIGKVPCKEDCCDECCPGGICCNYPGKCRQRIVERGKPPVWVCS